MKTNDLIHQLSIDVHPSGEKHFLAASFFWWMIGTLGILVFAFWWLDIRLDLPQKAGSLYFLAETLLCLVAFLTAVFVSYRSAIPGLLTRRNEQTGIILLGVIALVLLSKVSFHNLSGEFHGEMDFFRGRCGPIMLLLSTLDSALLLAVARRGAPTDPRRTGVWIALSAGAMSLFVMQFVCAYTNFLHVAIWHMTPVVTLTLIGSSLGRRLLRW